MNDSGGDESCKRAGKKETNCVVEMCKRRKDSDKRTENILKGTRHQLGQGRVGSDVRW